MPEDLHWYTPGLVEELLPDVWFLQNWDGGTRDAERPRSQGKPAEAGNRRAMMVDLSRAIATLNEEDGRFLADRYVLRPVESMSEWAKAWELTEDGARKRLHRIVEKLIDRMGGEPPYYTPTRRVRSNAALCRSCGGGVTHDPLPERPREAGQLTLPRVQSPSIGSLPERSSGKDQHDSR